MLWGCILCMCQLPLRQNQRRAIPSESSRIVRVRGRDQTEQGRRIQGEGDRHPVLRARGPPRRRPELARPLRRQATGWWLGVDFHAEGARPSRVGPRRLVVDRVTGWIGRDAHKSRQADSRSGRGMD
jgi:hypothetical protein